MGVLGSGTGFWAIFLQDCRGPSSLKLDRAGQEAGGVESHTLRCSCENSTPRVLRKGEESPTSRRVGRGHHEVAGSSAVLLAPPTQCGVAWAAGLAEWSSP